MRLLAALDRSPEHSGLMFVGDGRQAIYPGGFSLRSIGFDVRGRSFLLRTNWRNTQRIAEAAEGVLGDLAFGDIEEGKVIRPPDEIPLPLRLGAPAELHIVPGQEAEREVLLALIEEARGELTLGDIAVLGRTKKIWERAEKALRTADIPIVRLDEYKGQPVDAVRVGTFAKSKGLEFKMAILVGAGRSEWVQNPFWLKDEGDVLEHWATARRTLFVAMTRARDRLMVIATSEPGAPIEQARERFSELDWR